MKQYTPDEERERVSESSETTHFKFISQKVKAYKHFKTNDVIVDECSKVKYKITYIDDEFGLVYGRRICLSGALSKNLHHITGVYSTFIHDVDQINAILLNEDYDPVAREKIFAKRNREAYAQRIKQRKKIPSHPVYAKKWCDEHLKIGDTIWVNCSKIEDRDANLYKYTVQSINAGRLGLLNTRNNKKCEISYDNLYAHNIYLTLPVVHKDIP